LAVAGLGFTSASAAIITGMQVLSKAQHVSTSSPDTGVLLVAGGGDGQGAGPGGGGGDGQ